MFHARFLDGSQFDQPVGKVLCVGRNYAEHAKELNNPVPSKPLIFLKPATSIVDLHQPFSIPKHFGAVHHELELALLIGKPLHQASPNACHQAIAGFGLALDLTLRAVQEELKEKRQPWDIAKGFDGACPLSRFIPTQGIEPDFQAEFEMVRNGKVQQSGNTHDMIFSIPELLSYMSRYFTLQPGDIVLTGTPKGVGPLMAGDQLSMSLGNRIQFDTAVADS